MPVGLWNVFQGVSVPLHGAAITSIQAACVCTNQRALLFCTDDVNSCLLQYMPPATWPSPQKLIRVGAWGGVVAVAGLWLVQVSFLLARSC